MAELWMIIGVWLFIFAAFWNQFPYEYRILVAVLAVAAFVAAIVDKLPDKNG